MSQNRSVEPGTSVKQLVIKAKIHVIKREAEDREGQGRATPFWEGFNLHGYFDQMMYIGIRIFKIEGYEMAFPGEDYIIYFHPFFLDSRLYDWPLFAGTHLEIRDGGRFIVTALIEDIYEVEAKSPSQLQEKMRRTYTFVSLESALAQPEEVRHLHLFGQQLEAIGEELVFFPNLETLDVSDNLLRQLPDEVTQLKKLKKVKLGNNPNLDIEDTLAKLAALPNLTVLDLSAMKLSALPANLSALSKLEELYLGDNKFVDIPEVILSLPRLKVLDLSGNQLEEVDNKIGVLQQLRRLNLSHNRITKFALERKGNLALEVLNLGRNALDEISPELLSHTSLTMLHLSGNALAEISDGIGVLAELILLDARRNRISRVSSQLLRLRKLEKLYLDDNRVETLPEGMERLLSLWALSLRNNPLLLSVHEQVAWVKMLFL